MWHDLGQSVAVEETTGARVDCAHDALGIPFSVLGEEGLRREHSLRRLATSEVKLGGLKLSPDVIVPLVPGRAWPWGHENVGSS